MKDQGWRLWSDRDLHHDKGWKRSQEATEGEGVKGLMGSYGCHEGKGLRESKAVKKEKQVSRRSEDMATTRGRRQHRQGREVSVEGVVDEVWSGP